MGSFAPVSRNGYPEVDRAIYFVELFWFVCWPYRVFTPFGMRPILSDLVNNNNIK
jgi:hypothetical protein